MRISLVFSPDETEAMLGIGKYFVQRYEPLGLLYIAAVARKHGWQVSVIDAHAQKLNIEAVKREIFDQKPDVLGFSVLTCNGASSYELGRWAKETLPETLVVFGNVHASVFAKNFLQNDCCDVVVHGEGENVFPSIVEAYRAKTSFGSVPSISYRDERGLVVRTEPAQSLVEDLAVLPRPARDLVDQKLYGLDRISNQLYMGGWGSTKTISTSRGCNYSCSFCVVNQRLRFNAVERVVDEMECLEKEFGAKYAFIIDPLCMYDRTRMLGICDEIIRRKLKIKWGCDARVSCISPELIKAMEAANCYDLSFGIESGVQQLLNNVKKGTTIPQIIKSVQIVKDNSAIQVAGLFVLGLPGETYSHSLETIEFAKTLPLDMAQFSLCTPYPGSKLFEELATKGAIDTGIREDGSLDTSVWKRYSAYPFGEVEPAWVTPEQTPVQLKQLQKRANREFYLRPRQILRQLRRVRPSNILKSAAIAWGMFVEGERDGSSK